MDKVDNSANRHIFNQSGTIIGLFAKQPIAGQVKTRLTPPLSPEQACELYRVALQESISRLLTSGVTIAICYAGERSWFETAFPGLPLFAQHGEGLGARMTNAVQALFADGGGPVLLAGSDSPDLPLEQVKDVIECLARMDVATVPCRDGGYAIIGVRQPTPEIFKEIPWSTTAVLEATRRRCRELGLSYHETTGWHDLDELADLQRLVERSPGSLTARHIVGELSALL